LFLKSSNRDWSSVGMCLVTSHKCILIVLAKLELSSSIEWYNMLLKHPESDDWWLNLQILFIFFHHCDGLPFLTFWTLSKNCCVFRLLRTLLTLFLKRRYSVRSPRANALLHLATKVIKYGVIQGRSDYEILTVHTGIVCSQY